MNIIMSLSIDTIDNATIFTNTPTALESPVNYSDTTFGVTTEYLYKIGIPLSVSNDIRSTIIFTANIICNSIIGLSGSLSFLGNVALGRTGAITTFYGTNPFVANFPYWVSSSGTSKKMFAGVYTTTNGGTITFPTANRFSNNGLVIFTGSSDRAFGTSGTSTILTTLRFNPTGGSQTVNAIFIGP
jgi:hypothetical protein